jgi:hypothetical protein
MYTFDTNLVSDLHKDALGFRPTPEYMEMWHNGLTDYGRQAEWDWLLNALDASMRQEEEDTISALADFEAELAQVMVTGKCDELTALGWMTPVEFDESTPHTQDIEHWVWQVGILFTDRGREIVEKVKQIYGVK